MAMRAGADWIEAGTPLITFQGIRAIASLVQACPGKPILADLKAQDGVAKHFKEAGRQGAKTATVLGVVAKATADRDPRGDAAVGTGVSVGGRRHSSPPTKNSQSRFPMVLHELAIDVVEAEGHRPHPRRSVLITRNTESVQRLQHT